MTPYYWQQASSDLARDDPVMAGLVERYSDSSLISRGDPFGTLVRSIVGQQISIKAADSIWLRLSAIVPLMTPADILARDVEVLRGCGLSVRKVEYIGDLARHFSAGQIHVDRWSSMSDAEVIAELTAARNWRVDSRDVSDLQSVAAGCVSFRRH